MIIKAKYFLLSRRWPACPAGAGRRWPACPAGAGHRRPACPAGAGRRWPACPAGADRRWPTCPAGAGRRWPACPAFPAGPTLPDRPFQDYVILLSNMYEFFLPTIRKQQSLLISQTLPSLTVTICIMDDDKLNPLNQKRDVRLVI